MDEGRGRFLFRGEDDAVGGFDSEGGDALVDGIQGIFCARFSSESTSMTMRYHCLPI